MPGPEDILNGLRGLANAWRLLAIGWHVYFALLAGGALSGWRPARRILALLLVLPLFSVGALAWASGNPFNAAVFAITAITLVVIALRLPHGPVRTAPVWSRAAGVLMFIFGWLYPHFLDTPTSVAYLYAAPTGLLPCPTLSIVIGMTLIVGGLQSRAWSWVLAAVGLFYGAFGALYLGVRIDLVLIFGAVTTLLLVAGAIRSR